MVDILALQSGIDIPIPDIQLTLHQPTMKEISYIGQQDFVIGAQTFCISNKMVVGNFELNSTTNFQIFMAMMKEKELQDKKSAVLGLLSLLFPGRSVIFTPNSILLKEGDQVAILDDNNFNTIQDIVKEVCCLGDARSQDSGFNPANEQARRIAEKMMKNRQKVAELKANQGETANAFARYISVLTIGLNSMSLSEVLNLTLFQVYDLMERYSLYLNWDLDIRSRLAGGKPDGKPEDWMQSLH